MKCKDIQYHLREIYSSKENSHNIEIDSIKKHLSQCPECREYAEGLEQLKMIKKIEIPEVSQETIRLEQVKIFESISNENKYFSLKPIIAILFIAVIVMVVFLNLPVINSNEDSNISILSYESISYFSNSSYLSIYDTYSNVILSDSEINELIADDNSLSEEELSKEIEFMEYLLSENDV